MPRLVGVRVVEGDWGQRWQLPVSVSRPCLKRDCGGEDTLYSLAAETCQYTHTQNMLQLEAKSRGQPVTCLCSDNESERLLYF